MPFALAVTLIFLDKNGMKPIKSFNETLADELKNSEFKKAFLEYQEELAILDNMIQLRRETGLTQSAVAEKMVTSQSAVARIESGLSQGRLPSLSSLRRYANAVGKRLQIKLV